MMQILLYLCAFALFFISHLLAALQLETSECENEKFTTINDPRRSPANVHKSASNKERKLCDQGIIQDDKWYRFIGEAGGEIPTKQARPGGGGVQRYCNTRYFWHQIPIYPNLGEPINTKYPKYRKDRDIKSKCTK